MCCFAASRNDHRSHHTTAHTKHTLTHTCIVSPPAGIAEMEKERAPGSLDNVPSNIYESVCMPDFDEFFQAGGAYPTLPDHKPSMNGSAAAASSGSSSAASSTPSSYGGVEGECSWMRCGCVHEREEDE